MKDLQNNDSAHLTVADLIEYLQNFDPDLPVWIAHSDDPENAYHRMNKKDVEKGDIWLVGEEDDDGGQVEVPGIIIGERWFSP